MMLEERDLVEDAADRWWLFLLTGITWLIVALLIFQWNYTTVYAVSYLFGFMAIFAGVTGTAAFLPGVSAEPVTAQEIITFRAIFAP